MIEPDINIRGIEKASIANRESFSTSAWQVLATQGYRIEEESGHFILLHDSNRSVELMRAPSPDDLLMLLVITGAWSVNVDLMP